MKVRSKAVIPALILCGIASVLYVPPVRSQYDKIATKFRSPLYLSRVIHDDRYDLAVRYVNAGGRLECDAEEAKGMFSGYGSSQPLVEACDRYDPDEALYLLKAGAKVNVADGYKQTPLHKAMLHGHYKVVSELIERGANVNARDFDGSTPLDSFLRSSNVHDNPEVVKLMLEKGALLTETPEGIACSPDSPLASRQETISMLATRTIHRMPDVLIEQWVKEGANLRDPGSVFNNNLLATAADSCSAKIVGMLLDRGYSPNAKCEVNGKECRPLHIAARRGRKDVIELLIARGADVNAKDDEGRTPLDLLRKKAVIR